MKKFIHAFVGLFVMLITFQQMHAQGTTIANATALTAGAGSGTATGTGPAFATPFACSPTSGYATGCQSVGWYTIDVAAAATVTLDFQSTPAANDQDIFAVVFSANSCSTNDVDDLADLDCDRDGLGGIQISFDAAEQRTYYVMIGDFNCNDADGFTFDYTMTEAPLPAVNDEPCTATQVPFSNGCSSCVVTGTIGDYTESCLPGDPIDSVADCGSGSSSFDGENACRDAWYTVTVPASGNVDVTLVSLAGSSDLTMAVYTGLTCANTDMTFVACDDDSGVGALPELNLTGLTPGDQLYIRIWDFNCDSPTAEFELSVTAGAPILLNDGTDGTTVNLNCGTPQLFYDSGGAGIANGATDYSTNEDFSITFCATPGNVVRMSFLNIWNSTVSTGTIIRPNCDGTHAADLDAGGSTSGGGDLADYLTFHDGTTTGDPIISVNTGETLSYPSPGTIVSSGTCITVRFESSQSTVEEGWEAVVECIADITPSSTNVACAAGDTFTDDNFNAGGQTDIQQDDQYVTTFCPDIAGACIFAGDLAGFLTGINLNPNVDYMYVYNGTDDTSSPIAIFTGSSDNVLGNGVETLTNITGITAFNDWMPANPGGCLTFKVVSNNVCNYPNWQSSVGGFSIPIECVECDLGNGGGADCATATCINANGFWAGTNINDNGNGFDTVFNGGGTDPGESGGTGNYTIGCVDATGAGTSEITRLENTIWYQFSTPDICEELNLQILLNYISCQNERADDNGIQFVIWEGPVGAGTGCLGACPSLGDGWDNDAAGGVINAPGVSNGYDMFGCFDKLTAGQGVSVSNLNSNTHYYIMIDGFTGQHCFFDFYFDLFPPGITAPAVVPDPALFCSGSADAGSFSVTALDFVEFVYDPTPYTSVAMAQASISAANAYDNFSGGPTSLGVEANVGDPNNPSAVTTATTNFTGATFPVNNTCAIQVYNLYAIADDFPAGGYGNGSDATADDCFPFQVTQITIYPSFTVTTDGDGTCGTLTAVLEATDGTDCETATAVSCVADWDALNYDFSASATVTNLGAPPASCALPTLSGTLTCSGCGPVSCGCPTNCPSPPGTTPVQISGCPVEDGTYTDQAAQDAAADGTAANPFATWNAALAHAQGNGINHIQFAPGTYQTDNSVFNAFGLAGGWPVTSNNMYVDGQGATIIGNGTSVGFADVNANNVTFANLNLTNFAQALEIEDVGGFAYCNGIIDGSDNNALNGVFINSDAVNTDATFINVDFNNHDTPNFTSAMDIFASSVTEAINTTVTFCDSEWNCNQRDGFGGALFIGHGGGRGNPAWAGPIVCMQDGGFYDNLGIGNASDGGALNVQDNSTLTIDGTEFVCNDTNNNTGTSGGGAIRIQGGAAVDIQNANFTGNTTTQYGGAILFTVANAADPALTISNTVFWNNTAERGGGLYSGSETTTTVDGCYFEGNSSTGTNFAAGGGGIYIDAGPQATGNPDQTVFNLLNSTVTANTSADDSAGGMFVYEAETSSDDPPGSGQEDIITITNSVLCNNTSTNAPEADLSEDAYEPFLATGFSSITIDAASIIGNGLADNGVTNAADRDLSQGDCGNTAGIGYTAAPPAALACPACPATPATTSNCDACLADAGNMVRPTGGLLDPVTGNQTICIGDNLGDWVVDYNGAADEMSPPGTYDIALILTDALGNIVQVNYTGPFDFSILGVGTYTVYSLSYSPDNTPDNIAAYLAQLSSGVADGIGSNVSEIIADDDDTSSGGAGTGSFCLDIDNLDDLGLDSESQVVQVTIVEPLDAGDNGTAVACNDNTEGTSTVNLDSALLGTPDTGGTWTITTDPSAGSVAIGAGNVVDFNGLAVGTYIFTYTVTSAPCPDDSATVTIGVSDCNTCTAFNATLAGDNTVCDDNTASNLTVTMDGGTGPYEVIYSDGSSNIIVFTYNSGDNIPVAPAATTNYTLFSVEDANGCPGTLGGSATITVNTLVNAGIDGTDAACNDNTEGTSTVDLDDALLGTPDAGGAWSITTDPSGSAVIGAGNIVDFNGLAVGSYVFTYTVTATAPCTDDTAIVTVDVTDCDPCPAITATLAGDATVCEDNTASNLTVAIVGGTGPYDVVYSDGTNNFLVSGYASGANIPVSPMATTNYTLVSVDDANDCPATPAGSATITVNTLVDAGENGTDAACNDNTEGTSTVDLDNALLGTPDAGGAWSITTDPSGSASIGAGNVVDFNGLAVGSYVFTYTVTATAPCTDDTATVTVTVTDCDPCPAITATLAGDATVCEDNTASNLTVTIVGGTGPYDVIYSDGSSNTIVMSYNSGDNIPVSPAATTNYTLVSVEDANGCSATLAGSATVTVNTLVEAGIDNTVNTCNTTAEGSTVDLFGSLTGSPDTGGTWIETSGVSSGVAIPAGDLSGGTTIDFDGVTVGTYTFQYTAPGTAPCANDVSVVTVNVADCTTPTCPNITATLAGDNTVCEDNTASNLTVTILGGTAPYEVVYNTGIFNSVVFTYNSGDNIPVAPNATTNYTLVSVEDANGCPATLSGTATITVNTLPNAGIDGSTNTCNTTADGSMVDLFGNLGSSPDTGGSWIETSGTPSGIALPAGDLSGGTTIDFNGVAVGTYTFQYSVPGMAPCPSDVSVVTVNVEDCTSLIDLTLVKTVDNPTPLVGETVLFTITIANNGPDAATGVEVADYIPTGYTNITNISNAGTLTGSTINWAGVNLAVGESTDYTFEAEVTAINDYVNVAEITAHDQSDVDSTPNDGVDPDGDGNIGSEDPDSSQDTDSTNEDDSDDALVAPPLIDLNLTKVVDNPTPNVGGTVTFTITVSNDGPDDATGVEITDVVPTGYTNISNISNSGGLFGGNNIIWSGLNIANGGSVALTFDAEVLGSGDYVNIAEVTDADQTDTDSTPGNGADTDGDGNIGSQDPDANQDADDEDDGDDAEVVPSTPIDLIDLNLTKVVNNATPNVGGTVTFTITVSNDGPDDATGVEITDVVPSGYTNISNISNSGGLFGGNNIVWSGLNIANGGSVALTFDAEVLGSGDYVNIAEVTDADQTDTDSTPDNGADTDGDGNIGSQDPDANQDPDDEDDGDDAEVTPVTPVQLIDLNLTKVVDNATPNVGGTVTFTITVSNDGPDDATGVEITDVVPSGYTNISNISNSGGLFAGNNVIWNGLNIANGGSIVLTFDAEVLASGDYVNIAEVTDADQTDVDSTPGNGADTDGDGNIGSQDPDANQDADDEDDGDDAEVTPVTPVQLIDLNLTKVVDNMTPAVGSIVTFTITVSNDGPDDATGVEITDVVPAGYTNIANISTGGGLFGGNTIVWNGLNIANGASVVLTFDAEVTATANYINVAEVTAHDQTDTDSTPGNGADTDGDGNIGSQDPDANQDADDEDDGDDAWVVPSTPVDQIDVWLTKTVNNSTPNVGDMVTFTITVGNNGPDAATGVEITDYVPVGYTNIANISNGGGLFGGNTIVWNGISLANGANIVLTFDAEVTATADYVNVAEVTAHDQGDIDSVPNDGVDPDGDGNIGSEDPDSSQDTDSTNEDDSDDALVIPTQIDLSLTKVVDNTTPAIGGTVTFTITVMNDGPDDATNVAVQDIVPAGYTNISNLSSGGIATANVIDWTGLYIPNGASLALTFDAEVTSFPDYVNIAEVTAHDQTDIDSTPNNGADNDGDGNIGSTDPDATQDPDDEDDGDDAEVNPVIPSQLIDLNLTKIVDNMTPAVGGTVTFTITVSNDGPDDATGVEITDVVPAGYTNITNISNGGGLFGGNTIVWGGISLANGANIVLTFDAEVTGTANYVNIAEVTDADQADVDSTPGNGADTDGDGNIGSEDGDANQDADDEDDGDDAWVVPSTPVNLIDVWLTKTVNNTTPDIGDVVTFTITVGNNGPDAATGVEVSDYVPAGYTNITNISNGGGLFGGNTIVWDGISLANGANIVLTFDAEVTAIADYVNVAEVTAHDQGDIDSIPNDGVDPDGDGNIGSEDPDSSQDTDSTNEDDSDDALVMPNPPSQLIDLNLTKVVDNATPNVGDLVTFTITVSNEGPDDATNIEVYDALPSGYDYTFNTASAGIYNDATALWQIPFIANGTSETLGITVEVLGSGDYVNIAEIIGADQPDSDSTPDNGADTDGDGDIGSQDPDDNQDPDDEDDGDDATVTPVTPAVIDLNLVKSVSNMSPTVGSTVTFTITVSNDGPDDATGVEVTDAVPSGYTNITNISNSGGLFGGNTIVWSGMNIANGASVSLTFDAEVLATGDHTNIAEITDADQPDSDSTPDNGADTDGDGDIGSQDPDDNQDPDDEDDGDDATVTPITPVNLIDLNLVKSVSNTSPTVGSTVTFTITVSNDGPDDATGVEVTDAVPSGYVNITNISNSGGLFGGNTIIWSGLNVANGGSVSLTFDAEVLTTGDHTNIAEITDADQPDSDSTPDNGADTDGDGDIGSQDPDDNQDPDDEDDGDDATVTPITPVNLIDLNLVKSVSNMSPTVGSTVTFTITVSNDGPDDATGVEVTDAVPNGYANITNINNSGGLFGGNTIVWNGLNVANGASVSLTFDAEVLATGDHTNIAEITDADQPDSDSTPDNGADTDGDGDIGSQDPDDNQDPDDEDDGDDATVTPITPVNLIDLNLVKSVSNMSPTVGSTVTFTITVSNDGPDDATGVEVTDAVPSGYTNITNISNSGGLFGGNTIVWNNMNIANGASVSLTFDAEVLGTGDHTNIAEITDADQPDSDSTPDNGADTDGDGDIGSQDPDDNQDPDDEDDGDDATVTPVVPAVIDLNLTKVVDNATPNVGDFVTFTITVTNDGPDDATNVEVYDALPSGYVYTNNTASAGIYSDATGLWQIPFIANGGSETLGITVEVLGSGDYLNIAEITDADQPDSDSTPDNGADTDGDGDIGSQDPDDNQDPDDEDDGDDALVTPIPITPIIDLSLIKSANPMVAQVGETITFTIAVTNSGPDNATGVEVTDVVPTGYANIVNISNGGGLFGGNTVIWDDLNIANGETIMLTFEAEILASGDYTNLAEITAADQDDSDSTPNNGADTDGDGDVGSEDPDGSQDDDDEDDGDDATVTLFEPPVLVDLELTKTVDNPTPTIGETVNFTITVYNEGGTTATGIEVEELLPSGYTYAGHSTSQGNYNPITGLWSIGTMLADATETLTIEVVVLGTGEYLNVAEIVSTNETDIDSTPDNNDGDEDDQDEAIVDPQEPVSLIDLSLVKVVDNETPTIGENVTFTLTVNNAGPDIATGVMVQDFLPSGYSFVNSTGDQAVYDHTNGIWWVDSLMVGESQSINIMVEVLANGDYLNIADIVNANEPDIDSTPNNDVDPDGDGNIGSEDTDGTQDPDEEDDADDAVVIPYTPIIDLELEKVLDEPSIVVELGDTVTFTISVYNNGPDDATGVYVAEHMPLGYEHVSHVVSTGTFDPILNLWNVGSIASGETETLSIDVVVMVAAPQINIAQVVAADQEDSDSEPNNDDGDQSEDDEDSSGPLYVDTTCLEFEITTEVVCNNQDGTYEIVLTSNLDEESTLEGFTIVNNLNVTFEFDVQLPVVLGPFNAGTGFNYTIIPNAQPGCQTDIAASVVSCTVTAVELLRFEGEPLANANYLNWITATETDNDYFELTKSTDGVNFIPIATIAAAGNSSVQTAYSFNDLEIEAGKVYYQLQMVDLDGSRTQSNIVEIVRETAVQSISVMPNPVANVSWVNIQSATNQQAELSLYDVSGKLITNQVAEILQGNNQVELSFNALPNGVYMLAVKLDNEQMNFVKIVKQ